MQPTSIPRVPMRGTPTGKRAKKKGKNQKEKISCEKKRKRTSALGDSSEMDIGQTNMKISGDGHMF